jgi:sugar phosphate isomerase/epimerase
VDTGFFRSLVPLYAEGRIDHIQIQLVPEDDRSLSGRLQEFGAVDLPLVLHAPYHSHGVNPCQPGAFQDIAPAHAREKLDAAMQQTFEAADTLGSPLIILHAGVYEAGTRDEAVAGFLAFRETYPDRRLVLENLPAFFRGVPMLGTTAAELEMLSAPGHPGICLDFAHLYCTANYYGRLFSDELAGYERMAIRHHHLTNTEKGSIRDRHLALDHPDGGLDFSLVIPSIQRRPAVGTSLEYRTDAGFYRHQLACLDTLVRRSGTDRSAGRLKGPVRPETPR